MWNCSVVVPFGTRLNENTGDPDPHQRKLIDNADASAVPTARKAAAQTAKRMRMLTSPENFYEPALAEDSPKFDHALAALADWQGGEWIELPTDTPSACKMKEAPN